MATTHVFIVDTNTFDIHLKYLFVGTGAKEHVIDFNNNANSSLHHSPENLLVAMSADACRIRKGDKIIFYLQQQFGGVEGKFFGIFRATQNWSFLANNDGNQYLRAQLGKSLTFRALIEPDNVYAEGVTEWEALDEISNIQSPNQMLWSLIYRKLKGNRGNTMITIYESERLCQLIRNKNNRTNLLVNGNALSFSTDMQSIIVGNDERNIYNGGQEEIEILPRLISKFRINRAFESHLQSYIVKNIGLGTCPSLDSSILGDDFEMEWLGNEVSCGVGMQRIDVAVSLIQNEGRIFIPIELKAVEASLSNVKQVQRYIDWVEQYYIPNRQSDILPILVAKQYHNKNDGNYEDILVAFRQFNDNNKKRCHGIRYIEYWVVEEGLFFENVEY